MLMPRRKGTNPSSGSRSSAAALQLGEGVVLEEPAARQGACPGFRGDATQYAVAEAVHVETTQGWACSTTRSRWG